MLFSTYSQTLKWVRSNGTSGPELAMRDELDIWLTCSIARSSDTMKGVGSF